ncbi:flavin reductase [Candidatus Bathyarchaeota archaeon]|nr:flavin reductase [Candidatus Bathyarchaeota archaeon]
MGKMYFDECEMVMREPAPPKMPRTAVIPVVRNPDSGLLNAAPYSAGVLSIDPYHMIFGVKSWDSKSTYKDAEEFTIAVPSRDQIDQMWVMACAVPEGINAIDLAGWTELPSKSIGTPGIRECPLNIECRKAHFIQLKQPMRAIIVGEAIGVSIDKELLDMTRSEVLRKYPMHEATNNAYTGIYGPSVFSGELTPHAEAARKQDEACVTSAEKVFVDGGSLFKPANESVAMNAIFPRPSYVVVSLDEGGGVDALPVSGGLLMSARPSIQLALPKDSACYENVRRREEFVVSIPTRSHINGFESLEKGHGMEESQLTLLKPNRDMVTPGIAQHPVNIDCRTFVLEQVEGSDYALLVGKKVGMTIDEEALSMPVMQLYSQYLYSVFDRGMKRKWGFQDVNNLSVRPLPSWGSRYHGGWWTGPEQYQAGMHFWLIELVQAGYISEEEFFKMRRWLGWWRREGYPAPEPLRSILKERLTTVLKMMLWAHRDYDKWHEVHDYLARFPYEGPWKSP